MTSRLVFIDYGKDALGLVWWRERNKPTLHGPFASFDEAQRDSAVVMFGPQVRIHDGGKLDDATWTALEEGTEASKQ